MSVKISELPILASLADNDVIAGVDTSANVTSKIEMATLKNYIDTNTQYTAGTNIDITNNVVSAPNVYNKTETDGLIENLKDEKDEQIEELQSEVDSLSMIYNAFPTESGEGESLTLDDTAEVKFKKFDLKGNTSQDGTPTPSSPIPVNVVSGDNTIDICGKNVLPVSSLTSQTKNGITFTNHNDGSYTFNGTASAYTTFLIFQDLSFSGNYTYVLKDTATSGFTMYIQKNTGAGITDTTAYKTINNDVGRLLIGIQANTTLNNLTITPYVYKGNYDSSTTYEPYIGSSYPISLGTIELCKIGDYQDYFYKDSGKWYLYKIIYKKIFNETDTIEVLGTSTIRTLIAYNTGVTLESYAGGSVVPNILCTHLISASQAKSWVPGDISRRNQNPESLFYILEAGLTTTTGLQWLVNNNVVTYTPMAEPIVTEITYQPLIDQLNELEKAMSKEGQTNISQVSNDKPFILDVTAIKSLQNVLDRIELLES